MLRRQIHGIIGRLAHRSPAWRLARPFYADRIAILFYHAVWRPQDTRLRLFGGVGVDRLDADLRALSRRFRACALEDVLSVHAPGPGELPPLALTFDDGFDLMDECVLRVLARWQAPATVFVNTRSVNYATLMWQHQLSAIRAERGEQRFCLELNRLLEEIGESRRVHRFDQHIGVTRDWQTERKDEWAFEMWQRCEMPPMENFLAEHRPYLGWSALQRWIGAGHAVGFHTDSHPFCSKLTGDHLEAEIFAPVQELQARLGIVRPPFAYPFGDRLPPALERKVAERALFSCLLGTAGLSPVGCPAEALERVWAEPGIDAALFGQPLVRHLRGAISPRAA